MNLRTITCWAVYDPKRRVIVHMRRWKYEAAEMKAPYCVLVQLKGHYILERSSK